MLHICDAHTLLSIADFHLPGSAAGTITADITQLDGQVPTAVKYAFGNPNCCDMTDPTLGVTHVRQPRDHFGPSFRDV